jgi:hypothetical protein
MTPEEAVAFIRAHGVVLMSARGPVPSLAQAIAGSPIRGSWWAHPKAHEIFRILEAVSDCRDILACRLIDGKVTYIHRRIWPALVRLDKRLPRGRLAAIREEHTPQGKHRVTERPYPRWVPEEVLQEARDLTEARALTAMGEALVAHLGGTRRKRHR